STPTFVTPPIKPGNLHPELIPRNITIVRCYYDQDVVNPGTTFDFDIDGSGFTEDFYEMISVDFDAIDIQASDLRLVTANQIRGRIHVGPDATTQYVYPSVLIRNLPVFKADDAFGVVRSGEVLDIDLTQIDETGQNGRFRVITNLDQNLYRMFKVDPTTPRLEVSGLATRLPFYVEGTITIAPGLHNGQYGLIASLAGHELFRKNPLVDVVHPNVGRAGSIERVTATEAAHRPGDEVQMTMTGSGFAATDVANLTAKLESVSTEPAQFSFLTAGKMTIAMRLPPTIPTGVYGITVYNKQKQVYNRKAVFAVVPANWIAGVHLLHPVIPGQSGILQITGRDLSPVYVQTLRIATDEPGLSLSGLHLQDASTIVANVQVSTGTAPGDYLIHLTSQDKPVRMPTGNIIRVGS
ncbi:MAG TPA: hypothetical protein VMU17_00110, partial [Elusimicrobiota bacterium]|nr:hypothetical protein [Elusimicrobiota bacterium]